MDTTRLDADMQTLLASTQIATIFLDGEMAVRSYTPNAANVFRLAESDRGRPISEISHSFEQLDLCAELTRAVRELVPVEKTVKQVDSNIYHLLKIFPYTTSSDCADGALITLVDVTAAVRSQEQQRLLVAELNHRVRNMLQVVMGLANQSLHRSHDLAEFGKAFFGRMQGLARAYELLSRDGWHQVPIGELVRSQLLAFATDGSRYSVHGDAFVIKASAALSLGMVLYELATNATKYGALSVPSGHVAVEWRQENRAAGSDAFILHWKEFGGPRVDLPTRRGFGSELIQKQLRYELNGTSTMDFAETGLVVVLEIPAAEIIECTGAAGLR